LTHCTLDAPWWLRQWIIDALVATGCALVATGCALDALTHWGYRCWGEGRAGDPMNQK
jgi:hypothetical protein